MPIILAPTTPSPPAPTGCQDPSTIHIQDLVKTARAYPELTPIFATAGFTQEPALSIANDVMQKILAQGMNWEFNRATISPFLTVALQQDYIGVTPSSSGVGGVLDLGWLEACFRIDINNTVRPKPLFFMETVRNLGPT